MRNTINRKFTSIKQLLNPADVPGLFYLHLSPLHLKKVSHGQVEAGISQIWMADMKRFRRFEKGGK